MKKILIIFLLIGFLSCSQNKQKIKVPKGAAYEKIHIFSEPTTAKIFIEDQYIGNTPLKTKLFYTKEKFVNIKAEPIYENQIPQNIFIRIPPIPDKMTIYMHHRTRSKVKLDEEKNADQLDKTNKQIQPEVLVDTLFIEKLFTLPSVFFPTDVSEIQPDQHESILQIADILLQHKDFHLKIIGFADERGDFEYNKNLAMRRAIAVKKALVEKQIDESRLTIFSRGEQVTYDENGEKLELKRQRTVEFQLIQVEE